MNSDIYGWKGTILEVDLSKETIVKKPLGQNLRENFLGARGISSKMLYDMVEPGIDHRSPGNILMFGVGPFCGTIGPSNARVNVAAKTTKGAYLGYSSVGGRFGPELKYAGYDHIAVRGKASHPVYLWIDDDRVELRSAKHLWGKNTWETEDLIKQELGDSKVLIASIGPAGENLTHIGCIIISCVHGAGQTGLGAVMGSKNLKAIAVRGTGSVEVARPDEFVAYSKELINRITSHPFYPYLSTVGTLGTLTAINEVGVIPLKNFSQAGGWEGIEKVGHGAFQPYTTSMQACGSCPVHCRRHFKIKEGRYKGEAGGSVDFGTASVPGYCLYIEDTEACLRYVNRCNQLGVDTVAFSFVLAAATEWYEKGIITSKDTDGIPLEWGNADSLLKMLEKFSHREGFGDLLAEGIPVAAARIGKGAEECISMCRGQQLMGLEPRALVGSALSYVTATIPLHDEEGAPPVEYTGAFVPMPEEEATKKFGTPDACTPLSYAKARVTAYFQDICLLSDAVGMCKFITEYGLGAVGFDEMAQLFEKCTGVEMDGEKLRAASHRIRTVERAFLVREGITRKDDKLLGKIATEPIQKGLPSQIGLALDMEKFSKMLDEYYQLRGWDVETGIPTKEKLHELGLDYIAKDLQKRNKLPR
jgi:aldehyde:ferredoxin oxidoreductase